jgi:hypothetical protein
MAYYIFLEYIFEEITVIKTLTNHKRFAYRPNNCLFDKLRNEFASDSSHRRNWKGPEEELGEEK